MSKVKKKMEFIIINPKHIKIKCTIDEIGETISILEDKNTK